MTSSRQGVLVIEGQTEKAIADRFLVTRAAATGLYSLQYP